MAEAPVSGKLVGDWASWPEDMASISGAKEVLEGAQLQLQGTRVGPYQLKTDYAHKPEWRGGPQLYVYNIPSGYQPEFMGVQGDTGISLCWQAAGKGTQVVMQTQNGNGTSALVYFVRTNRQPSTRCM